MNTDMHEERYSRAVKEENRYYLVTGNSAHCNIVIKLRDKTDPFFLIYSLPLVFYDLDYSKNSEIIEKSHDLFSVSILLLKIFSVTGFFRPS